MHRFPNLAKKEDRHHLHQEHHQFMNHIDKIQGRHQTENEQDPKIKSREGEMTADRIRRVLARVQVRIQKLNQNDQEGVRIEVIEEVKIEDMKPKDQNYRERKTKDMLNALLNIQNQVIRRHINLSKIIFTI